MLVLAVVFFQLLAQIPSDWNRYARQHSALELLLRQQHSTKLANGPNDIHQCDYSSDSIGPLTTFEGEGHPTVQSPGHPRGNTGTNPSTEQGHTRSANKENQSHEYSCGLTHEYNLSNFINEHLRRIRMINQVFHLLDSQAKSPELVQTAKSR